MEWYERPRAVMSLAIPVLDGEGFMFYLWTDELTVIQMIMNLPCVTRINWFGPSSTINNRQWREKVSVVVNSESAWDEITQVLDEHFLGEVWGQALFELFQSDAQQ